MHRIISKIKNSTIGLRLVNGISWSLFGSVAGKGLMIIAFIFVARIIGQNAYGQVGIIRSTIVMFLAFSSAGMGLTASRYIAVYRNANPQKARQIYLASNKIALFSGLIIAILVFIFSPQITHYFFGNTSLTISLRISSLAIFLITMSSAQNGVLNGFEDFKSIGIISIIHGVIQLILLVIGAKYCGINGVIWALALSAGCLYLLNRVAIKKQFTKTERLPVKKIFDKNIAAIFLKFSLPAILSGLVTIPILWWSKTQLIQQTNFTEMAIYDVAEQWYNILIFIPAALGGIILPILSNTLVEGTKAQYNKLIKINLAVNAGITLLFAIIITPLSSFIIKFYGEEFTKNYLPLQIMLFTAVFYATNNVLGQVIASKGKMWAGFAINVLWAVWLFLFSILFINKLSLGAEGLAYAMLASYVLHSITQSFIAFKIKI